MSLVQLVHQTDNASDWGGEGDIVLPVPITGDDLRIDASIPGRRLQVEQIEDEGQQRRARQQYQTGRPRSWQVVTVRAMMMAERAKPGKT